MTKLRITRAVSAVSMSSVISVPLVIEAGGQVGPEADVVLGQEGDVEQLSLEVVAVQIGRVRAVS